MSVPADADPEAQAAAAARFRVRFYEPRDRATVRRICADTGFLSKPIDPLFEDRELFADYLTRYYTDYEPESTLVCELDGEILGYLNGCRRSKAPRRTRSRIASGKRSAQSAKDPTWRVAAPRTRRRRRATPSAAGTRRP